MIALSDPTSPLDFPVSSCIRVFTWCLPYELYGKAPRRPSRNLLRTTSVRQNNWSS